VPVKGLSTQGIVNTFPPWSNIRLDEQSLGFQLLNRPGVLLDDLRKQIERIGANYFLPTSIVSDIDLYYRFKLPKTYQFTEDDDASEMLFTAPTVSGMLDGTSYDVTIATDNSVEQFWYHTVPDRLSLETTVTGAHLLASGQASSSPFDPLTPSGLLHLDNYLWVTASGGTTYFGFDENLPRRGIVHITGTTRAGENVTEEIPFVHDEIKHTVRDYHTIDEVKVYGIEEAADTYIEVSSANFNAIDYASAYQLAANSDGNAMPLFWTLGKGLFTGQYSLDLLKYNANELDLRLDGWIDKSTLLSIELLDTNSENIVPEDLAVEPWSDNIWVVSSGNLYLYSADLPYPETIALISKDYEANCVIEPSSNTVLMSGQIELDYHWRRPVIGVVAHRVWVEKPDGNKYSIEEGLETTYHTDRTSWTFGEPINRNLRAGDIFTLGQRGNHIYSLETSYTDESSSIDQRIVSVVYKQPTAEFSLTGIIPDNNKIVGVDFDSENKLWVLDDTGDKHQINCHYDVMLADINKKILYFRENYDQVRVYD